MTTIDLAPEPVSRASAVFPGKRLIAVAIAAVERHSGVLAWAAGEAVPEVDTVEVVHAFVPMRVEGSSWEPMEAERQARRRRAERVVASSVQRLRSACPGLRVDGAAFGGLSVDVLVEVSGLVDLIVVGEDDVTAARPRTAWRTLTRAGCPVVSVPPDWEPEPVKQDAPVTVLIDTLDLPAPPMAMGFAEAERHRTTLRVAQYWSALHEAAPVTPTLIADRQQRLDEMLQTWRGQHPSVGVIGELLLADDAATMRRLRAGSRLIIVPAGSPHALGLAGPSEHGNCPTMTLPGRSAPAAT